MSADAWLGAGILISCCIVSVLIGAYAASRGFERALKQILKDRGIDPDEEPNNPEE